MQKKIVRKAIKKEAKNKPKKELIISLFIIFIIFILIITASYFLISLTKYNYNIKVVNDLIIGIILILISPFILSFSKMTIKTCQNKKISYKELFTDLIDPKFIKLFSILIISLIIVMWLFKLIPGVGIFINLVILILYIPVFLMLPFTYLEYKETTPKEILFKLPNIVSQNRITIYGLLISFSFWIILALCTFGILLFYVIPYIYISLALLYTHLTHEKEFKKETALSDGGIILIFIGIIVLITTFLVINVPSSKIWFKAIITGEVNNNAGSEVLTYGGIEITYDTPKGYKASAETETSKTYISDDNQNILQYSIYLSDIKTIIEMDKEIVNEMSLSSDYKKVKAEEFNVKINNKKINCYKYLTQKDNTSSSTIIAYYPKGNFVVSISLSNSNGEELSQKDIKEFITIY